jgi:hypothetical protein
MTLAKAKAKTNETFIVQASLTIVTYDCQNMFMYRPQVLIARGNTFRIVYNTCEYGSKSDPIVGNYTITILGLIIDICF